MRAVSSAFTDAVVNGGTRVDRAFLLPGDGSRVELPLVSWSVSASRSAVCRYTGTAEFASDVDVSLVQPYGARIQLLSGFNTGAGEELVPVLTGRIEEVASDESGSLVVSLKGLEAAVEDNRFWTPQMIDASSAVGEIRRLVSESIPGVDIVILTQSDALAPQSIYDRERWQAVDGSDQSLARAIGAEVYCDAEGRFVVRDVPTLNDASVWSVSGATVLVSYATQVSRSGVYNVVVATGDRMGTGENPEVAIGLALDDDPLSATYYLGTFGTVVRFYSSPLLVDSTQAFRAAKSLLAESIGLSRSLSFTNVPNPALEPGDVVEVTLPDGTVQRHILDSIRLGSSGAQSCETRMTQGLT
jgi:hypothetical protein